MKLFTSTTHKEPPATTVYEGSCCSMKYSFSTHTNLTVPTLHNGGEMIHINIFSHTPYRSCLPRQYMKECGLFWLIIHKKPPPTLYSRGTSHKYCDYILPIRPFPRQYMRGNDAYKYHHNKFFKGVLLFCLCRDNI